MPCLWLVYTPKKTLVEKVLLGLVEKTMITYVQLALVDYLLPIYNFDLWMSKGMRDGFVVVVSFISSDWEAKHVTIGLFEVLNTSSATMVLKLQELLDKFSLTQKKFVSLWMKGATCKDVQVP
jgi:hypothetical protein